MPPIEAELRGAEVAHGNLRGAASLNRRRAAVPIIPSAAVREGRHGDHQHDSFDGDRQVWPAFRLPRVHSSSLSQPPLRIPESGTMPTLEQLLAGR
jgi:hypothetical protein